MRFDVVERQVFGGEKGAEGADLVPYAGGEFLGGHSHGAAAEAEEVGEARVGAYSYVMGFAEGDCAGHGDGVAGASMLC